MKRLFLFIIQSRNPFETEAFGKINQSSRLRIKAETLREATEEAYRCISPELIESLIVVELDKAAKR